LGGGIGARVGVGAAAGGMSSVMSGGDFAEGALQGAWSSAIAYVANDMFHRVRLLFDGKTLKWTQNGEVVRSWPAHSGMEDPLSYEPIPEGSYYTSSRDFELHPIEEHESWGPFSYRLHEGLVTRAFNRYNARSGGFHIHGGYSQGTAGCIEFQDYSRQQTNLYEFHRMMQGHGKTVNLIVDYN
jgi:hypothetical protein